MSERWAIAPTLPMTIVVAASTALSDVDGERGELIIAGYRIDELAAHATFEETTWLLWRGELPSAAALEAFRGQLAAARASQDDERYSGMLDWGLRLVVLLAVPSSIALLLFGVPLVATLFHYGAFTDADVRQVAIALAVLLWQRRWPEIAQAIRQPRLLGMAVVTAAMVRAERAKNCIFAVVGK